MFKVNIIFTLCMIGLFGCNAGFKVINELPPSLESNKITSNITGKVDLKSGLTAKSTSQKINALCRNAKVEVHELAQDGSMIDDLIAESEIKYDGQFSLSLPNNYMDSSLLNKKAAVLVFKNCSYSNLIRPLTGLSEQDISVSSNLISRLLFTDNKPKFKEAIIFSAAMLDSLIAKLSSAGTEDQAYELVSTPGSILKEQFYLVFNLEPEVLNANVTKSPPTIMIISSVSQLTNSLSNIFNLTASNLNQGIKKFECQLDESSWEICDGLKIYPLLLPGAHVFSARVYDNLGLVSDVQSFSWFIDSTAPKLSLLKKPAQLVSATVATFEFAANDLNQLKYFCSIDNASAIDCTSPATYSSLKSGARVFKVQAQDSAGNLSSEIVYNWTIDLSPPEVKLLSRPASSTVSTQASFQFSGSDVGGSNLKEFQCALDNEIYKICVSPQNYTDLLKGSHVFKVRAVDALNNISQAIPVSWIIKLDENADTIAPINKITSVTDKNATAAQIKIEGICETGLNVSLYQNGTLLGSVACATGLFVFDNVINLRSAWILKSQQIDLAGNKGENELLIDGIVQQQVNINGDGFVSSIDGATQTTDLTSVTLAINSSSTKDQIQNEVYAKLETARPGTRIIWPAGQYNDLGDMRLHRIVNRVYVCPSGQSQKPIVIEASQPGQVIFNGYTRFSMCGSYIVFRGFSFVGTASTASAVINLGHGTYGACLYCAVRQMHFDGLNQVSASTSSLTYISVGNGANSRNNEITDSRFEKKSGLGVIIYVDPDSEYENNETTVRIRGNYFHRTYPGSGNGFEIFRFGNSESSQLRGKVILEHNLIENTTSEGETVSVKSRNNIVRFNTFYQVAGAVTNRVGFGSIFEGNYFLGNNLSGVGAMRITGKDHLIVANHIEGIAGSGSSSSSIQSFVFHNTDTDMKSSARTSESQDKTNICDYTNYCPIVNTTLFGNYFINNSAYITANIATSKSESSFSEDNDNLAKPLDVKMYSNIMNAANGRSVFAAPGSYDWAGFSDLKENWYAGPLGLTLPNLVKGFISTQKLNVFSNSAYRFSLPDSASRAQLTLVASKADQLNLTAEQRLSLLTYNKNLYQVGLPLRTADVGQYTQVYRYPDQKNLEVKNKPQLNQLLNDVFNSGSQQVIQFSSNDVNIMSEPVQLEYSVDGGTTWITSLTNLRNGPNTQNGGCTIASGKTGCVNWTVPQADTTQFSIRLKFFDKNQTPYYSNSNNALTVLPANSLILKFPMIDSSFGDGRIDTIPELLSYAKAKYVKGDLHITILSGTYTGSTLWDFAPPQAKVTIRGESPTNRPIFDGCLNSCIQGEKGAFLRLQARNNPNGYIKNFTIKDIVVQNYTNGITMYYLEKGTFQNIYFRRIGTFFNNNIVLVSGIRQWDGYSALGTNSSSDLIIENNQFEDLYNDERPQLMHATYINSTTNTIVRNNTVKMVSGTPLNLRNGNVGITFQNNIVSLSGPNGAVGTFEIPGEECLSHDITVDSNTFGMNFPYKKIYNGIGWGDKLYIKEGMSLSDGVRVTTAPNMSPLNCAYRNAASKLDVFKVSQTKFSLDANDERVFKAADGAVVNGDEGVILKNNSNLTFETNILVVACDTSTEDACDDKGTATIADDVDDFNNPQVTQIYRLSLRVKSSASVKTFQLSGGGYVTQNINVPASETSEWILLPLPQLKITNRNQSVIKIKSLSDNLIIDKMILEH